MLEGLYHADITEQSVSDALQFPGDVSYKVQVLSKGVLCCTVPFRGSAVAELSPGGGEGF